MTALSYLLLNELHVLQVLFLAPRGSSGGVQCLQSDPWYRWLWTRNWNKQTHNKLTILYSQLAPVWTRIEIRFNLIGSVLWHNLNKGSVLGHNWTLKIVLWRKSTLKCVLWRKSTLKHVLTLECVLWQNLTLRSVLWNNMTLRSMSWHVQNCMGKAILMLPYFWNSWRSLTLGSVL